MLTNDWEMADSIVHSLVVEGNTDKVRVLNDVGGVVVSSEPDEVGTHFNRQQPACQICHAEDNTPKNKTVIFNTQNGRQVLLNVNLIQNRPECQGCHDPQNSILGLLIIETPLASVKNQLTESFWRTALIALGSLALLTGLIMPALNRYIIQPVEALAQGVDEISAGNLDYQVPVFNQDELGELAGAFNDMRQKLKASYEEMERREHELAILNEVASAATQLLDLQEIMDFTLDIIVNKFGMAIGMIYLLDEATGRYRLRASHGLSEAQIEEIARRRRSGWDITQQVAETGKEVFVANMAADVRFQGVWDDLENRSFVKLPLMSKGAVVGVMGLITHPNSPITAREVEYLKSIGLEIGIAVNNAMLLAETRRSEQEALTLYNLGTKISTSLALNEVLGAVAEAARELLAADIGLVGLLDGERQEVIIKAAAGLRANALKGMTIPVSERTPGRTLMEGQPIMADAYESDQIFLHGEDLIINEHIASFLAVPLLRGECFLGLIEVMTRQQRRFSGHDAQLLRRLAHHVVVAIENARLYRQLRYLATLEERDRLARELHDHLAQALGYLNVKASITDEQLDAGKIDLAQESLLELKKVTKIIYTDVREAIFNLRTAVSSRIGLIPTLQDYLTEYRAYYGVDARLIIENGEVAELSPEVAGQLLRIIQEALTNVRKHAEARRVWVRCKQESGQICITIEDDGKGFNLEQDKGGSRQRFGLQIMRERAESVGGNLTLDSRPQKGTRVIVRIPPTLEE